MLPVSLWLWVLPQSRASPPSQQDGMWSRCTELSGSWTLSPCPGDKVKCGSCSRKPYHHCCPVPCGCWHHYGQEAEVTCTASAAAIKLSGGTSTAIARGRVPKSRSLHCYCPFPLPGLWWGARAQAKLPGRGNQGCNHSLCHFPLSASPVHCNPPTLWCTDVWITQVT